MLHGFSNARASVELLDLTPMGKNLIGVAPNPCGGRDGLAGREWEEEGGIWEKKAGRVKWVEVGGVGSTNLDSISFKLKSECMRGWWVGEGGALLCTTCVSVWVDVWGGRVG